MPVCVVSSTAKWKFIVQASWHLCSPTNAVYCILWSANCCRQALGFKRSFFFFLPLPSTNYSQGPRATTIVWCCKLCSDIDLLKWGAHAEFQAYWNSLFFRLSKIKKINHSKSVKCVLHQLHLQKKMCFLVCSKDTKTRQLSKHLDLKFAIKSSEISSLRFQTSQISFLLGRPALRQLSDHEQSFSFKWTWQTSMLLQIRSRSRHCGGFSAFVRHKKKNKPKKKKSAKFFCKALGAEGRMSMWVVSCSRIIYVGRTSRIWLAKIRVRGMR